MNSSEANSAKKIICAGHVILDIAPVFPAHKTYHELSEILIPGHLTHTEAADIHTGGSVSNTGIALKLLGNDVILLGKTGDDSLGGMIRSIYASYGVSGLITDTKGSSSYTVVLTIPGLDRLFLHYPGVNDTFYCEDIPDEPLDEAAWFHFGYPPLMQSMYEHDGEELEKIFRRAKEKGLVTSLDFADIDPNSGAGAADWKTILTRVLPYVDFCMPSFEELCFMLDRTRYERLSRKPGDMTENLDLQKEALPLAEELIRLGCRAALVKCGTSGMVYRVAEKKSLDMIGGRIELDKDLWANKTGIQPCFKPDIVRSATGAGDTSIAAYITAVLQGKGPAECAALAAAEGACCVTAYDAISGVKPLKEIETRLKKGWETL